MKIITLIGIPGCGKTTFCKKFFPELTRILRDEIGDTKKEHQTILEYLEQNSDFAIDDINHIKNTRKKIYDNGIHTIDVDSCGWIKNINDTTGSQEYQEINKMSCPELIERNSIGGPYQNKENKLFAQAKISNCNFVKDYDELDQTRIRYLVRVPIRI